MGIALCADFTTDIMEGGNEVSEANGMMHESAMEQGFSDAPALTRPSESVEFLYVLSRKICTLLIDKTFTGDYTEKCG